MRWARDRPHLPFLDFDRGASGVKDNYRHRPSRSLDFWIKEQALPLYRAYPDVRLLFSLHDFFTTRITEYMMQEMHHCHHDLC
jgi:hypothetical protein